MSAIFISHSSEDRAAAQEMMQRLRAQNYEAVFLDFDGERGIAAGKDWEAELYRNLSICRAAIVLLSEKWIASRWCFAEFCLAKALGKEIFPVRIAPCRADTLLGRLQIVDLPTEGESGYRRLWDGLREAGLDPADDFAVDRTRPPYPGFNYFEQKDAGIYFGRDADIKRVLDALTRMSNHREPPLAVVIGGSGSGKSSLVRAGVIPRLKKNSKSWIVVPPFRPGRNAVTHLAQALADSFAKESKKRVEWEEIRDQILDCSQAGSGKEGHAAALLRFIADLTKNVGGEDPNRLNATVVVVVDQFEELLLGRGKPTPRDALGRSETDLFLELLQGLYEHSDGTVQVLATLRSDFFEAFLKCLRPSGNQFESIALAPMPNDALFQVIEGPAARFGIKLEAALVNRMVADTGTNDALPLLAFTLREMWERYRREMPFSLEVYEKQLGGIQGAVERAVDEIRIDPSQEPDLRRTFLKMVRVNEDEGFVRQPARWSELPESAQPLMLQFVEARLLSSDGEKVEVVHESLFRVWKKLAGWLAESREFLLWKKRTDGERKKWEESGFSQAFLLKEGRLVEAERLTRKYDEDLTPQLWDFVKKSSQLREEEVRREKARQQLLRRLTMILAALALLAILGAIFGFWQKGNADKQAELATSAEQQAKEGKAEAEHQAALARNQALLARAVERKARESASRANVSLAQYMLEDRKDVLALALLAQALRLDPRNHSAGALTGAMLVQANWAIPMAGRMRHNAEIYSAQFSADGQRVVTASYDNTARIWDAATGKAIGEPMRHDGQVVSAQFSADGQRVVTASYDKTARVWNAATGKAIGEPMRHENFVNSAQFSADGQRVVTASGDKTARIWDAATGKAIGEPMWHDGVVSLAQFSADGQRVVTASHDKTARVWDAATGKAIGEPMRQEDFVYSAQFSPDGQRVVTASGDKTARVWDAATGKAIGEPMRHDALVISAQFSADGQRVVTASYDKTARVWDAATGKAIGEPMRHDGQVISAQFSADGQRVVTASYDKTARVWDAATGKAIGEPMRHDGEVFSAQFSADGQRVVTASYDETAQVWDAATGKAIGEPMRHDEVVISAQFSPDGQRVVTASYDKTARVWDVATGKAIGEPMRHDDLVNSAQFSPDGQQVVTASDDKTARVWDAATGKAIGEPMRHDGEVISAQFSADGQRVVTASFDKTARVWNAATGKAIEESMRHENFVHSAQFSPDGQRVVTASADNTARVWDAATGKAIGEPMRHDGQVISAQFSADGQRVVTASYDKTARVWDAATGKAIGEPMRHDALVYSARFSPDGQRVVTASYDETAQVWDAATGKAIGESMRHENFVHSAQFSPDGQRVVTASGDNTARVWDAATGKAIGEPMRHDREVISAQFSPDGQRVVTASYDNTAQVWDAPAMSNQDKPDDVLLLADLAEAACGSVLQASGQSEILILLSPTHVRATREKIAARFERQSTGSTPVERLLKWSVTDSNQRTISTFSKLTVPEWIENRIKEGTLDNLRTAVLVDPANPRLSAHFGLALANLAVAETTDPDVARRARAEADYQTYRAVELASDNDEVKKLRAEVVTLLNLSSHQKKEH